MWESPHVVHYILGTLFWSSMAHGYMMRDSGIGRIEVHLALLCLGVILVFISSCRSWFPVEVTEPLEALLPVDGEEIPLVLDDMELGSLRRACLESLRYLDGLDPQKDFRLGPKKVKTWELRDTISHLMGLLDKNPDPETLGRALRRDFLWFQAAGKERVTRSVLVTGYYSPRIMGSREKRGSFVYPLYGLPQDLIQVDLGLFREELRGQRLVGRLDGNRLVPYFNRAEIDKEAKLSGKGLEILWLQDPLQRFFLHIQGSGEIFLEDGQRIFVNYAGSNGHPYRSIGRILMERGEIPKERMSMQAIRDHLLRHPEQMESLFLENPSYVFFRVVPNGPLGSLELPLTPGRSIATDSRLFPPGALAVLCSHLPRVDRDGNVGSGASFCRLTLNQDTGGAIRGAGRVDLYCGSGEEAEFLAGHLQNTGKLFFLLLADPSLARGSQAR